MLHHKRIIWATAMGCLSTLMLSSSVLAGLLSTNMYVNIHPIQKALAQEDEEDGEEESSSQEEEQTLEEPTTFAPVEPNPQQEELCEDGLDNDADGSIDEDCPPSQVPQEQGICMVEGCPGQEEICNDGLDNDADGSIDEDCPVQLPQESGPTLPDFGAGEPPPLPGEQGGGGSVLPGIIGGPPLTGVFEGPPLSAIDEPEVSNILLPRKCVSYELFKLLKSISGEEVQAMTCAKIVKYPDTNQTVAFVEQWFNGNKVYDSAFPKSTDFPCRYCDETIVGMVGKWQVRIHLELWSDYNKLDLGSAFRTDLATNIKEPSGPGGNLFVWPSPTPQPQEIPYSPTKN